MVAFFFEDSVYKDIINKDLKLINDTDYTGQEENIFLNSISHTNTKNGGVHKENIIISFFIYEIYCFFFSLFKDVWVR
jgi:hypothetical protein